MIENQSIGNKDFSNDFSGESEFENCTFTNCSLANADLTNIAFRECVFYDCDFSVAKLTNTILADVRFENCKMLGLNFPDCRDLLFSVDFEDCALNLSSFYKVKLKKTRFRTCQLNEVDFAEADLSSAIFENCDLAKAIFDGTSLEKADLRTAYNYSIDPDNNKIKKARFSRDGIAGLLAKYDIEVE